MSCADSDEIRFMYIYVKLNSSTDWQVEGSIQWFLQPHPKDEARPTRRRLLRSAHLTIHGSHLLNFTYQLLIVVRSCGLLAQQYDEAFCLGVWPAVIKASGVVCICLSEHLWFTFDSVPLLHQSQWICDWILGIQLVKSHQLDPSKPSGTCRKADRANTVYNVKIKANGFQSQLREFGHVTHIHTLYFRKLKLYFSR